MSRDQFTHTTTEARIEQAVLRAEESLQSNTNSEKQLARDVLWLLNIIAKITQMSRPYHDHQAAELEHT